jgi:nucleoside-diphosphate-sugar epimerase
VKEMEYFLPLGPWDYGSCLTIWRTILCKMNKTIVILGGTGYIGRHLLATLAAWKNIRIKVLARPQFQEHHSLQWPEQVELVQGDLNDANSLHNLFEPGCTVINLVYSWEGGEQDNLVMIRNLLDACHSAGIARLIYCSTAVVSGRISENQLDEAAECRPLTEYGATKLKIEQKLLAGAKGHFDTIILRPTAVFGPGPGGKQLKKLTNDLLHGKPWRNYLKSCLFGRRRMNLVYIDNVIAAILFLIQYAKPIKGEIYIVSDDAFPNNNFVAVERYLMHSLGVPDYPLPRIPLPLSFLSLLLRGLGRDNINPLSDYSQKKLEDLGFKSPVDFETGLANYADWYRAHQLTSS